MKRLLTYRDRAHLAAARALLALLRLEAPPGHSLILWARDGRVIVDTYADGPAPAAARSGLPILPAPGPDACDVSVAAWLAGVEAGVLYEAGRVA